MVKKGKINKKSKPETETALKNKNKNCKESIAFCMMLPYLEGLGYNLGEEKGLPRPNKFPVEMEAFKCSTLSWLSE